MKALVTGGAGFIGSNLVARQRREGHEVTVLDDFSSGYRENLAAFPEVEVVEGDVRESLADISAAARAFGYRPSIDLAYGLEEYLSWAPEVLVEH